MVFYGQTTDGIPDRGHVLFITALGMLLTATFFVAIQIATRIHLKKFGWDDISLVIALAASAMTTTAINLGKSKRTLLHHECGHLFSHHKLTFSFQPWCMVMAGTKQIWVRVCTQLSG